MGQPFRGQTPEEVTRQGIRTFEGNAALKQYDQDMYRQKQDPSQNASLQYQAQKAAQQMSYGQGMPANVVGGLGSGIAAGLGGQTRSYGGFAGGIYNTANQIDDRKNFISGAVAGLGEQAYAGGDPNFDERSGQFNNLIRYNDPRSAQGPDRMGMPQAYPDRIADPMRPQGDRGPLTRVSPGVYRNTQGQLTGPGGRAMPNQPNRNPAQGYATDMYNNMQPQSPQDNISDMFNNMVQQPGYPNGKGPARDVYSPMGSGGYDLNQAQNPIYRSPGYNYNLPQNTNVMPGYGRYRGR
jgi:hypothetical protein